MIEWTLFVVDDEIAIRDAVTLNLRDYRVFAFPDGEEAVKAAGENPPDLVLMDVGLPGINGVEAMRRILALAPETLFIMITAYEDVDTVVAAMKLGAFDYVVKPLYMDTLKTGIKNALATIRLRKEVRLLQEKFLRENMPCFIGESRGIQDVMEFVRQVAQSPDAPILIVGETGTGKELIASAIHYQSPHCRGPFVTLNCAALPKDLIESELFGYEGGAFSGASPKGKAGLIEKADGGTLFLDEVGDLNPEAQAKLLRFLDSGEFYKVGGTRAYKANARVVSATNRKLEIMIEEDLFRRDLYYRLAVIKVELPSLNRRREDILPIARFFLQEFSEKYKKDFRGLEPETEEFLLHHQWRGNVRELKGLMERGVLTGSGPLLPLRDLGVGPPARTEPTGSGLKNDLLPPMSADGVDLPGLLESVEAHYIQDALKLCGGSDSRAAKLLGLNYYTFRYRRKKLLEG